MAINDMGTFHPGGGLPKYDFYITITRGMQFGWGSNVDIPWMIELGQHDLNQQGIIMARLGK